MAAGAISSSGASEPKRVKNGRAGFKSEAMLNDERASIKNGVDFEAHAAGISHQRGSWLACRREILLNSSAHPAKNP
jgi:hypothetical protein